MIRGGDGAAGGVGSADFWVIARDAHFFANYRECARRGVVEFSVNRREKKTRIKEEKN